MVLIRLLQILFNKIRKRKRDFFLCYKYFQIRDYYGTRCLDIGSGTGRFAHFLRNKNHMVKAIDVVNKSEHPELELSLFDGKNIPFEDNHFETSILMFVLHHTDNAAELIKECVRVTSKKVIIGEDIILSCLDQVLGNIHLGTSPWSKSSNGFKTDRGWIQLFSKFKLRLVDMINIPRDVYPVYPIARKIYILEVIK